MAISPSQTISGISSNGGQMVVEFKRILAERDSRAVRRALRRALPVVILLLFAVGALLILKNVVMGGGKTSVAQVAIQGPLASESLNQSFSFPLKDDKGTQLSQVGYEVTTAELRNQIIVNGQIATAIQGKVFLILEVKVTNQYTKAIDVNTRDYIRLTVGDQTSEYLAPDIHNDPVNVQAGSTKYTRLGFAINATDKNLVLYIGEIGGKKQTILLNLKK